MVEIDKQLEALDELLELDKVEMVEYGEDDETLYEIIVVIWRELEDDEMVIFDENEQSEVEVILELEDDEIDDFELYVVEMVELQDIRQLEMVEKQSLMFIDLFWEHIHFKTM